MDEAAGSCIRISLLKRDTQMWVNSSRGVVGAHRSGRLSGRSMLERTRWLRRMGAAHAPPMKRIPERRSRVRFSTPLRWPFGALRRVAFACVCWCVRARAATPCDDADDDAVTAGRRCPFGEHQFVALLRAVVIQNPRCDRQRHRSCVLFFRDSVRV